MNFHTFRRCTAKAITRVYRAHQDTLEDRDKVALKVLVAEVADTDMEGGLTFHALWAAWLAAEYEKSVGGELAFDDLRSMFYELMRDRVTYASRLAPELETSLLSLLAA